MLSLDPAKKNLKRDTIVYFTVFVLIGTAAISGLLFAYYHYRAYQVVEAAGQTEHAFLGLLKTVISEQGTATDPDRIASLLSLSADVPQGRILLLNSDSSLIYPPGGLTDIPVADTVPKGYNAAFCSTFPEVWATISSQHTDQILDKKGLYVFTTFPPFPSKGAPFTAATRKNRHSRPAPFHQKGTSWFLLFPANPSTAGCRSCV